MVLSVLITSLKPGASSFGQLPLLGAQAIFISLCVRVFNFANWPCDVCVVKCDEVSSFEYSIMSYLADATPQSVVKNDDDDDDDDDNDDDSDDDDDHHRSQC